jgi:hypothetical protein
MDAAGAERPDDYVIEPFGPTDLAIHLSARC